MCMYMNDMANLILILSCIHVHVGIYSGFVCYYMYFFVGHCMGSGVAFYSSGFGQHDHLDALILGRKSVVVALLCPRFALINEID